MDLIPFSSLSELPTGQGTLIDITSNNDLIDISENFILSNVRGRRKPYYVGIRAFLFDAKIAFEFDAQYKLHSVEFRQPYDVQNASALYFQGKNLLQDTLISAQKILLEAKIPFEISDVGIDAPEIGLSFYSDSFDDSLDVELDSVTVFFRQNIP
ncbi:conserved hypothetical protein [Roseibium sp. TrichSKD4]|uniref:hypothetical protein n=1 Tax=Roseibium sp. TrichSKD4 TaxID=744980 RepID=UPI0001E56D4B|nr:hypothetical protein [Roseibium sp. TrichSKD4]EFO33271.1 conserved hypothetical protein [Roseibium sp. TrichSKD4]